MRFFFVFFPAPLLPSACKSAPQNSEARCSAFYSSFHTGTLLAVCSCRPSLNLSFILDRLAPLLLARFVFLCGHEHHSRHKPSKRTRTRIGNYPLSSPPSPLSSPPLPTCITFHSSCYSHRAFQARPAGTLSLPTPPTYTRAASLTSLPRATLSLCSHNSERLHPGFTPAPTPPHTSPAAPLQIVDINLCRDPKTGKSKGFCFLQYEDQRSTVLAVDNLNGAELLGCADGCTRRAAVCAPLTGTIQPQAARGPQGDVLGTQA